MCDQSIGCPCSKSIARVLDHRVEKNVNPAGELLTIHILFCLYFSLERVYN